MSGRVNGLEGEAALRRDRVDDPPGKALITFTDELDNPALQQALRPEGYGVSEAASDSGSSGVATHHVTISKPPRRRKSPTGDSTQRAHEHCRQADRSRNRFGAEQSQLLHERRIIFPQSANGLRMVNVTLFSDVPGWHRIRGKGARS
jgi:hypothetical protein